ncbi:MAG TPA: MFS transporter [Pyrinomonadaceae bacterium]
MKQCPSCGRTYSDPSMSFCFEDGAVLSAPFSTNAFPQRGVEPPPTAVMNPNQPAPTVAAGSGPYQSTITAVNIGGQVPTPKTESVSPFWQIQVSATSFFALFAIVGLALYGLPYYYDYMVREFGWTRTQVTSGNAFSKLIIGPLFGFFAGWIVDRFGPRRLMLVGILFAGIALIGLGNTNVLGLFYFFYLLNALGYVCAGPLPNQVLLTRWFTKSRGKAMGFAYLGIGMGGFLVFQISKLLVPVVGWHLSLTVLGVLIIVIAFPLAFFVKESPHKAVANAPKTATQTAPMGWAFKSPLFYLLAIGSMCSIGAVGGANQHLKLFMSLDLHFTDSEAANVASLVLVSSLIGRLVMGWLADHIAKKYVMLLIYMLVAIGISLLFFAKVPGVIYLFAIIFGIGLGGDYMIIPLMAAELFGLKIMGRLMGIVLTADGVAEAVAPLVVANLRDKTGSYLIGFSILVLLALVGAVAVGLLPRKPNLIKRNELA